MKIQIRNPNLIDEELKTLAREMEDTPFIIFYPILRQFWNWIKLESEVSVSDALLADKQVKALVEKGYPFEEALEFMLIRLLKKDEAKNPMIREFLEKLLEPVGRA
jgi:hypothetical protein